MARHKDRVVAEIKRVRRKVSNRLMKAHRQGRLREELRAFEKAGMDLLREAVGPAAVHRGRKRQQP
jgi:hypothetical protein